MAWWQKQQQHPFERQERQAIKQEYETRRLQQNAVLEERNLHEARFGFKARAVQVEQLLDHGGELEDAGHFDQALKCYQKALSQEPEHHELREHIALLTRRLNAIASIHKHAARDEELADQLVREGVGLSLPLQSCGQEWDLKPRGRAMLGGASPLSATQYCVALKAQAKEDALRKAAAKKHEARLDRQELHHAAAQHACDKHHHHVAGGNVKLQHKNNLQEQVKQRKQQIVQRFIEEMQTSGGPGPSSPLLGIGEQDMRRAAALLQHRSRDWHLEQGRIAQAAVNFPNASASIEGQQGSLSPRCNARPYHVQAPFARPNVDYPVRPISASDVRARQQVFYDKHRKHTPPERSGQHYVAPNDYHRPVDWQGFKAAAVAVTQSAAKQYHDHKRR